MGSPPDWSSTGKGIAPAPLVVSPQSLFHILSERPALWGCEGGWHVALWRAHGVPLAAVFQAGCGRAMVQLELLWAAVGLMLLGVAISLCVRCQLSGKATPAHFGVLPAALAWAGGVTPGTAFSFGGSPPGGCGPTQPRAGLGSFAMAGIIPAAWAGEGSLLVDREQLEGKDPPTCNTLSLGWAQHPRLQTLLHGHRGGWLWGTPHRRTISRCANPAGALGQSRHGRTGWGCIIHTLNTRGAGQAPTRAGGSSPLLSAGWVLLGQAAGWGFGDRNGWLACFAVSKTNTTLGFKNGLKKKKIKTLSQLLLAASVVRLCSWLTMVCDCVLLVFLIFNSQIILCLPATKREKQPSERRSQ